MASGPSGRGTLEGRDDDTWGAGLLILDARWLRSASKNVDDVLVPDLRLGVRPVVPFAQRQRLTVEGSPPTPPATASGRALTSAPVELSPARFAALRA